MEEGAPRRPGDLVTTTLTKSLPDGRCHRTVTASSAARAVSLTTVGGSVESITVTLKLVVAELPCASLAVHVTVVVPSLKRAWGIGRQATPTCPSTVSVALGVVESARV